MCFKGLRYVGIIGICVTVLLALLIILRFNTFLNYIKRVGDDFKNKKRRLVLLSLLLAAVLVNLPLYIGLTFECETLLWAFAMYKFYQPFILAAFTIVVSDWVRVIHDNQSTIQPPLFIRDRALIFYNIITFALTIIGTGLLSTTSNFSQYIHSDFYTSSYFVTAAITIMLSCTMFVAGMSLAFRLHGNAAAPGSGQSFYDGIKRLNIVMGTCLGSAVIQITGLALNFIFDKYQDENEAIFELPLVVFYLWTYWFPEICWVVSLLHLYRTSIPKSADAAAVFDKPKKIKKPDTSFSSSSKVTAADSRSMHTRVTNDDSSNSINKSANNSTNVDVNQMRGLYLPYSTGGNNAHYDIERGQQPTTPLLSDQHEELYDDEDENDDLLDGMMRRKKKLTNDEDNRGSLKSGSGQSTSEEEEESVLTTLVTAIVPSDKFRNLFGGKPVLAVNTNNSDLEFERHENSSQFTPAQGRAVLSSSAQSGFSVISPSPNTTGPTRFGFAQSVDSDGRVTNIDGSVASSSDNRPSQYRTDDDDGFSDMGDGGKNDNNNDNSLAAFSMFEG